MLLHIIYLLAILIQLPTDDPLARYRDDAISRWEADIRKLEELDTKEVDPDHAILFVGSSSIRLWDSIAEDMAPWPTVRRGYGGAKFSDLCVFVERLVEPHKFDALVVFVANDISASENDKSPEEVLRLFQLLVEKVRQSHADEPIFFIGITPSSSRFKVWDKISTANRLIRENCEANEGLFYIDTAQRYLTPSGTPNDSLFQEDQLHLNRQGYKLWGEIIKAELGKVLTPVSP